MYLGYKDIVPIFSGEFLLILLQSLLKLLKIFTGYALELLGLPEVATGIKRQEVKILARSILVSLILRIISPVFVIK